MSEPTNEQLRELLAKATQGEWRAGRGENTGEWPTDVFAGDSSDSIATLTMDERESEMGANTALIVAAVNALPRLLDAVRDVAALRAEMADIDRAMDGGITFGDVSSGRARFLLSQCDRAAAFGDALDALRAENARLLEALTDEQDAAARWKARAERAEADVDGLEAEVARLNAIVSAPPCAQCAVGRSTHVDIGPADRPVRLLCCGSSDCCITFRGNTSDGWTRGPLEGA